MSRDQKPGKIKLVSTSAGQAPHHTRFEEGEGADAGGIDEHTNSPSEPKLSIFSPVLFLISCAIGGAAAVLLTPMIG